MNISFELLKQNNLLSRLIWFWKTPVIVTNKAGLSKVEKILRSHHLHLLLQWKFKLWAGNFAWGVNAKHCWALSTTFWKQKVCWQQCIALLPQVNFPANNLNFPWRWRWWDQIQAIFLNLFYWQINMTRVSKTVTFLNWFGF